MEATGKILPWMIGLWVLVILFTGFAFGFGHVLALVVSTGLLTWAYWRVVPRMDLSYSYESFYSMEVK